jgi:hypothetical protein
VPEFKVVHDEEREATSRGRKAFTFLVDGVPSLMWFPNASSEEHPGRPADYFAQRTIRRLQEGRSTEAFGGPTVVNGGERQHALGLRAGRGKVVEAPQPEAEAAPDIRGKPRSARPRYKYELDGKSSEETYATEAEAKAACAVAAFMTRGRLGKLSAAQEALAEEYPDAECEVYVCDKRHKVCATVDGEDYVVGFEPDGTFRFKKMSELEPDEEE